MQSLILGIAGGSGSGKTYLAKRLAEEAADQATVLSMDQYFDSSHHAAAERIAEVDFDHPARVNLQLLSAHLQALKAGEAVMVPEYDFVTQTGTSEARLVEPKAVVLVEGLFLLADPLREQFDFTVFLDVASDQRLIGRLLRDVRERGSGLEEVIDRYQRFVRHSYEVFVEPTKQYADVVVDFTYRREFFQELLCRAIRLLAANPSESAAALAEIRKKRFAPGLLPGLKMSERGMDILELIRRYPERHAADSSNRESRAAPLDDGGGP